MIPYFYISAVIQAEYVHLLNAKTVIWIFIPMKTSDLIKNKFNEIMKLNYNLSRSHPLLMWNKSVILIYFELYCPLSPLTNLNLNFHFCAVTTVLQMSEFCHHLAVAVCMQLLEHKCY
jgi:hypothetical protein